MEIKTDFLVLGSGIAGLSFAVKASALGDVAVVTKKNNLNPTQTTPKVVLPLSTIKRIVMNTTSRTLWSAEAVFAMKMLLNSWLRKAPPELRN